MRTPSPATCIATLALVVATTGTSIAATKIDGHSIKAHSIPASALITHSLTNAQIKQHSLTKLALDPNAVTVVNNISAPQGPKGDQGAEIVGAPGAPGQPGTPGANSPHAWGIVHADGTLGDSANLTVRKPASTTGVYCLSTGGFNPHNAIAVAQVWGSQPTYATPGYVAPGDICNADEFQIDSTNTAGFVDSIFSVVIS